MSFAGDFVHDRLDELRDTGRRPMDLAVWSLKSSVLVNVLTCQSNQLHHGLRVATFLAGPGTYFHEYVADQLTVQKLMSTLYNMPFITFDIDLRNKEAQAPVPKILDGMLRKAET